MRVPKKGPPKKASRYAAPRPTAIEMLALGKQFNQTGTEFLKVDVATALTFASTARLSQDPAKKLRNRKSARLAYDTVTRMIERVTLGASDAAELTANLKRLKAELIELGEAF